MVQRWALELWTNQPTEGRRQRQLPSSSALTPLPCFANELLAYLPDLNLLRAAEPHQLA